MKTIMTLAAGAAMTLSLAGCIAVSDNSGPGSVESNTELAVRVCGSEANVAEVTEEGYRCKPDALK